MCSERTAIEIRAVLTVAPAPSFLEVFLEKIHGPETRRDVSGCRIIESDGTTRFPRHETRLPFGGTRTRTGEKVVRRRARSSFARGSVADKYKTTFVTGFIIFFRSDVYDACSRIPSRTITATDDAKRYART